MDLNTLLSELRSQQGSDIHLVVGEPPIFRISGELQRQGEERLDAATIEHLLQPHLDDRAKDMLFGALDVGVNIRHETGLFRGRVFKERGFLCAAFRAVPPRVPTLEELGFQDSVLTKLAQVKRGLIIVTGPSGNGKTTTAVAMLEEINRTRTERIVTVESPIEYEFTNKKSIISQRNVGEDAHEFPAALRAAFYSDPDVLYVSELRDLESFHLTLSLAEAGHLVFTTMHVETTSGAINRLIDSFPDGQKPTIRHLLSHNLTAVIAQKLLPRKGGVGRVAAQEILIGTPRIRQMIRDGYNDFILAIEAERSIGVQTMDDAIVKLAQSGAISTTLANLNIHDKSRYLTDTVEG
jgi:twitching motility protein PilT